jgi:hypothetical protein
VANLLLCVMGCPPFGFPPGCLLITGRPR